ncbi:MAG TPA: 4Fe-4S dicluster domain-containing protein [Patescibacteria group bacterium]|nr:4Fe-4S dicluster domain-containing protein [Patescibacteria group bacterium]
MANEIVEKVQAAGVVGAGGAGFPTQVKINATVDVIIANGAECEPLLRAHQLLMAAESEKIFLGMQAVMAATGAKSAYIGLKRKYYDAVRNLQAVIDRSGDSRIQLYFLPDFYPAGDEHALLHEVTGRIVPEGGIPLNVGVIVINVETLLNVAQAMVDTPVTEKYLTVGGAVRQPITLKVPLGMKISQLIELAGGANVSEYGLVDGGPMMGKIISGDDVVTKTTGGILVLPKDHPVITNKNMPWQVVINRARAVCCNCRACTDNCPRNLLGHSLEPHRIMQAVGSGAGADSGAVTTAFLCSECGACDTFGCTMGLSPRRVNMELKRQMAKAGIKNPHHEKPLKARANREFRRIPTKRIVARLGLMAYDVEAPLSDKKVEPQEVRLPLVQHIGAPAQPVVKTGDVVQAGDLIARIPEGTVVGANLHASISGTVFAVENYIGIRR